MKLRASRASRCACAATAAPRTATSTRRSTPPARGACRPCSWSTTTVGDLGAARGADRGRDAGAEGDRRGHPGRAGRRQRRDRGAPGVAEALARARGGRRAERDRGADLPPVRPHHRRRRQPLSQPRGRERALGRDPIARLRTYLVEAGAWSKADEERLVQEINGEIDAAVERYLKTRPQPPEAMFDYLYAELPRGAGRAARCRRGRRGRPPCLRSP